MPCYHPLLGYRSSDINPETGKRSIVFTPLDSCGITVTIPCGQCIGCRLERSRQWAIRCMHEAQMHDANSFITLTFNDQYVNSDRSLVVSDFQKFMKRLRKAVSPQKIRYYHCGEYGEQTARPHHHACIFGYDFPDKKLWQIKYGNKLYRSDFLEKLWSDPETGESFGYSAIGDVTFDS